MSQRIRLCVASVAQCAAESAQTDLKWLSEHERARLALITAPRRRTQFLAGHWLVRRALSAFTGVSNSNWALEATVDGVPILPLLPDICLSISHSGDWVVCAVSHAAVGVDIEAPKRLRDVRKLMPAVYSEAELREASGLNTTEREQQFYRIWTLKEAWLKSHRQAVDFARLPALHTCAALGRQDENSGNGRVWHGPSVTLALVSDCDAEPEIDGWPGSPASRWVVTSVAC